MTIPRCRVLKRLKVRRVLLIFCLVVTGIWIFLGIKDTIKRRNGYRGRFAQVSSEQHSGTSDSSNLTDEANDSTTYKRNHVKKMMKFAWDSYVTYAWGTNELKPISGQGGGGARLGDARVGATIIDSLDTLKLMGLEEEFLRARDWVAEKFDMGSAVSIWSFTYTSISVFEANIRLLGGLLSAHALTLDNMFMEKAIEVADILMVAFRFSPSGLPHSRMPVPLLFGLVLPWSASECVSIAAAGSLHLEFAYLTEITGDTRYLDKVRHIRQVIKKTRTQEGFYPSMLAFCNGSACPGQFDVSLGATADSFYEYLYKSWLLSGKKDTDAKVMFDDALIALEKNLLRTSRGGHQYFAQLNINGDLVHYVDHLACFAGGLYALSARDSSNPERRMEIARNITKTCYVSYNQTKTKIGPEAFEFDYQGNPVPAFDGKAYLLRPETIESYYYLWKMTGDEQYRSWAWEAGQAIDTHCRRQHGFTGVANVNEIPTKGDDIQQSFFLAETLKYLYLIFQDGDPLPLDTWVLNTEAHPLPVISSELFGRVFYSWRGETFRPEAQIYTL